jgi:hypothetical protein
VGHDAVLPDRDRCESQPDPDPGFLGEHGGLQVQPEVPRVSKEGPFEQVRRVRPAHPQLLAETDEHHGRLPPDIYLVG